MTNLMQVTENAVVSMTSLEIVEFINSRRPEGSAELTHADFMKKVPKVLGEKDAGNFSDIYFDLYNREQRCYRFPKRESMLMAMSYDYAAQAAIYDRWQELETQVRTQPPVRTAVTKKDQVVIKQVQELDTKLNQLISLQVPKMAEKKTIVNWNNEHRKTLAKLQFEICDLKNNACEEKASSNTSICATSHEKWSLLRRLQEQELQLEELIQRNDQYDQILIEQRVLKAALLSLSTQTVGAVQSKLLELYESLS